MLQSAYEQWCIKNQKPQGINQQEYINGLKYQFIEMNDGWMAVWEHNTNNGEYNPVIQAADLGKARSYCVFLEPINVPFNVINP